MSFRSGFLVVYAQKWDCWVIWKVEREVGGGIGMGNTCKPMAVSFQCMTKFTTNKNILIIIKINK